MSFQTILKVEKPDFYIDLAFRRAKAKVSEAKKSNADPLNKQKDADLARIRTILETIDKLFEKIVKSFPDLNQLTDFYYELLKISLDIASLKKSFGAVNWARTKLAEFSRMYILKVKRAKTNADLSRLRREFYGRFSSIVKQIKNELAFLEEARKILRRFPVVKNMHTVVIFGFPNIGKTTLMYKLTGSKPEIGSYAFTTKSINVGYIQKKVQFLDVPGTLNRFNKMNDIEKQASVALKILADEVIYVFDVTEPYPLKDQEKLLKSLKGHKVRFYLSKKDLLEPKDVVAFKKKHKVLDAKELKKLILADADRAAAR